jgi:sugar lactone lactonase YvrE
MPVAATLRAFTPATLALLTFVPAGHAQIAGFDADRWDLANAQVVEHLGRQAVTGTALLRNVQLQDGVVEVDVAMRAGVRAYPGVLFRVQSASDYERIYLRPHRSPLYGDAIQYVAAFNGVDTWQLYNGPGYTAGAVLPTERWVHVRLEVLGSQARLFLDNAPRPALIVWDLQHPVTRGGIGIDSGPSEGPPAAFFSNFTWRDEPPPPFGPAPPPYSPPGFLRDWEISRPVARRLLDFDHYPDVVKTRMGPWIPARAQPRGVLDIARVHGRSGAEPEAVLARTVLRADRDETRLFRFGYSDEASLFLNGRLVFQGTSAYRSRDSSFLGVMGLFDAVALSLRRGDNELLFVIGESSGGWGVMVQDASATLEANGVRREWTSEAVMRVPESAAYDPARDAIYVSNYDGYNPSAGAGRQHLSRLTADGKVETLQWVAGLNNPTGLAVRGDRLYAVERRHLVEIDIPAARILARHPAQAALALNDVAIAASGDVFVSDFAKGAVFRLANGQLEEWLSGVELAGANGIHVHDGRLVVVTNGDRCVKTVDLSTRAIATVATLPFGILDGVKTDGDGNYLVSCNEGRLLRVSPAGEVTVVLDLVAQGTNIADFDYVPQRDLVVFPTFLDNRVVAYALGAR